MDKIEFIEKAKKVHGDKYDYSLVKYTNNKTKVKIICSKHGGFTQVPNSHLSGTGCPKCGGSFSVNTKEFIVKARKVHGDLYDYSNVEYINAHTKIDIICPIHGLFRQKPNNHTNLKNGCPKCCGNIKMDTSIFVDKAIKVHGDKYDYSRVKYINSYTKIEIVCNKHGIFWQRPNQHISQESGCPICNESKGELEVSRLLNDNNIKYIREYKFDDCRNINTLPFDFYLPNKNILIEYDGIQHFKPFDYLGGEAELKNRKYNDKIKTNYCIKNDIKLVRIKYTKNVKNELIKGEIINNE